MKSRIVYASMTGNDEDIAEILEEDLQDAGFDVTTSDISFTDPSDYLTSDLCVLVTYTYGEGVMTDELKDFYDGLTKLDLANKPFAVMGSGDRVYGTAYCQNVFDFEKLFKQLGAVEVIAPVTVDQSPDEAAIARIDAAAETISHKLHG